MSGIKPSDRTLLSDAGEQPPSSGGQASMQLPEDVIRPSETIRLLHDALLPAAVQTSRPPQGRLPLAHQADTTLWLVSSGSATLYRASDGLRLGIVPAPLIVGLQFLFYPACRYYVQVSRDASLFALPVTTAREILESGGLWKAVAGVMAYTIRLMLFRDEHMVSRASWTTIRAKLIEYMNNRDILTREYAGVVSYIQATTPLSRSLIYQTLSELSRGGYITIKGGVLQSIRRLPERF